MFINKPRYAVKNKIQIEQTNKKNTNQQNLFQTHRENNGLIMKMEKLCLQKNENVEYLNGSE